MIFFCPAPVIFLPVVICTGSYYLNLSLSLDCTVENKVS